MLHITVFSQSISADFKQNKLDEKNNNNFGMYFAGVYAGPASTVGVGFTFFDEMLKLQVNAFPYVPSGQISPVSGWAIGTNM